MSWYDHRIYKILIGSHIIVYKDLSYYDSQQYNVWRFWKTHLGCLRVIYLI